MTLNNIKKIEGLEQNEALEKLDLTCNFVTYPLCIENLKVIDAFFHPYISLKIEFYWVNDACFHPYVYLHTPILMNEILSSIKS